MMRPLNGVIAALTLVPAVALGSGRISLPIKIAIATFFIASFGYLINDLCDFRADKVNKPTRPFPSRRVSAWEAVNGALLCIVLAALALAGSSLAVWLFFAVFAACLFLYSFRISSWLIVANLWVALLCSSAFLLGGIITSPSAERQAMFVVAAALTFFYHLGREIIKDIEDIAGDRIMGRKTIPIAWGNAVAKSVAVAALALMIATSLIAYFICHFSEAYLLLVSLAVNLPVVLIVGLFVLREGEDNIRRASIALKIVMIPALVTLTVAGIG